MLFSQQQQKEVNINCDYWKKYIYMTADHQNKGQSLISIWCTSQRFDCILTVFTRKKARQLTRRRLMKRDAPPWLIVFQPLWLVHNFLLCFFGVLLPHESAAVRLLCCVSWSWALVGNHASRISIYSVVPVPVDVVLVKSYNDLQSNLSVRTPLYYGQFSMSRQNSQYIFFKKKPLYDGLSLIRTTDTKSRP